MKGIKVLKEGQKVTVQGVVSSASCNTNDGIFTDPSIIFIKNNLIK
ncbi:MAG: hypothetical protein LBB59_04845 [Campylobacteraceae bacterium]|jgi:hypothetical protein|nr:hypothetical protein [Campylobacteraceae bacterium]